VADLKARIQAISDRLAEEGVSPAHLAIIEDAPRYARAESYLDQVGIVARRDSDRIKQITTTILNVDVTSFEGISDFADIKSLDDRIATGRAKINAHLADALAEVAKIVVAYEECETAFNERKVEFNTRYKDAVDQQTAHKNLITDNTRLTGELQTAETLAAQVVAREGETQIAVKAFVDAQVELEGLLATRRAILKSAADKVAGKSSNLLKARVKRDPAPAEYVRSMCAVFESSHVQDVETFCSAFVKELAKTAPSDGWKRTMKQMLDIYEKKIMAGSPPEPGEKIADAIAELFGRTFTSRQTLRIYQNLNDGTVGSLLSGAPRDYISLTYIDEGRDIEFRKASEGQQASALLELLLRQSAGTLIIDQPEDDLDNRVIMRIVDMIRSSKSQRQLIFTTHNPNIVVNGDADKTLALLSPEPDVQVGRDSARIQIDTDGAIETEAVKEIITRIMEGGKEAFDLRRRKYRFQATSY
jgi:chromosome segregation protein